VSCCRGKRDLYLREKETYTSGKKRPIPQGKATYTSGKKDTYTSGEKRPIPQGKRGLYLREKEAYTSGKRDLYLCFRLCAAQERPSSAPIFLFFFICSLFYFFFHLSSTLFTLVYAVNHELCWRCSCIALDRALLLRVGLF